MGKHFAKSEKFANNYTKFVEFANNFMKFVELANNFTIFVGLAKNFYEVYKSCDQLYKVWETRQGKFGKLVGPAKTLWSLEIERLNLIDWNFSFI